MNLTTSIDHYIQFMRSAGKAQTTQYDTRMDLRRVVRFLEGQGLTDTSDLTAAAVAGIAEDWKDSKPRSRNRYAVSLRGWLSWLSLEGHVAGDLAGVVPSFSIPRGNAYTVPPADEMRRVIESAPAGSRDRALLELLALGVNPYECACAMLTDYNRSTGAITVGKGTKRRTLELPTAAWAAINAYLDDGRERFAGRHSKGLFLNNQGTNVSRVVPWNALRYACEVTNVKLTARALRAARVASLLKADMDPAAVAKQMGMSSVASATRYLDAVTEGAA